MNWKKFLINEVSDRASQRDVHKVVWNVMMLPATLAFNGFGYHRWMRLLKRLEIEERDLTERIEVRIKEENVTNSQAFAKAGRTQPYLRMNECYVVERGDLFIFPLHSPRTIHDFFTEIHDPRVISFSGSKYPYDSIWKVPTLSNIQNIEIANGWTVISLKGEVFNNNIEIRLHKQLEAGRIN